MEDAAINKAIDELYRLTGEDFHGYRSEIWGVISTAIRESSSPCPACAERERKMVWTSISPTVPGWYWWKNYHGTCKIEYVYKHPDRDEMCVLENTYAGWAYKKIDNMGREWAGPIPNPSGFSAARKERG